MNGIKTILTMMVAAYAVPWATKHGLTFDAVDQGQVVGVGLAGMAIAMRFVSTGPALGDIRAWFANRAKPAQPVDVAALTDQVIAEILRRKAAKQQETKT